MSIEFNLFCPNCRIEFDMIDIVGFVAPPPSDLQENSASDIGTIRFACSCTSRLEMRYSIELEAHVSEIIEEEPNNVPA